MHEFIYEPFKEGIYEPLKETINEPLFFNRMLLEHPNIGVPGLCVFHACRWSFALTFDFVGNTICNPYIYPKGLPAYRGYHLTNYFYPNFWTFVNMLTRPARPFHIPTRVCPNVAYLNLVLPNATKPLATLDIHPVE